ncbi:MAG: Zn-ribbon domain-containing OB-fold protein [Bauldia sp.]|uniref:Zn-ribbon domain-containing OB-fold protein n=1 Tax=Bauldia sp. TaxID=2575872 RepID=UPI001E10AA4C|nr:Zn-ribbon domain-containing OB-fold protein [Bauldia sp.]MCB1494340.1 Zn-ribbon domain-containing OB-fold protein [Bauldia sp.]
MTDLSGLRTPGPTIIALTEPFWKGGEEGHLMIQRCRSCGRVVFYPRAICPHCWSEDLAWEQASGRGRLKSFSEVHKPGHPGWLPVTPYVVGLVELEEGPTMLSHVLAAGRPPKVGDTLVMEPTDIGGRILPAFRLE